MLGERFQLTAVLGRGSVGTVYRAIQRPLGRTVAIKVLRADVPLEARRMYLERFRREAQVTAALRHPNVVTVYDYGRAPDGRLYIAMEYVSGVTLRDVLKRGPMGPARAAAVFGQLLTGLQAAHHLGLVHRDIKPANVMLTRTWDGREVVKLLDFGLAKEMEEETRTSFGTMMGTPRYMPPEQARGDTADHRADLYSVGVMLYEALAGQPPYVAQGAVAMALCHVQNAYPPMAKIKGVLVPQQVESLVRRAMEKEPSDRFQSAGEMNGVLQLAVGSTPARESLVQSRRFEARDWVALCVIGMLMMAVIMLLVAILTGNAEHLSLRGDPSCSVIASGG